MVFAGTPEVSAVALQALLASRHELVSVITRPDAPAGRGRTLQRSPVGRLADECGIPVLTPTSLKDPDFQSALADLAPDCVPVVAYGNLVPPALLATPRLGWINLHFSLLPAWRGAAPVQWSLMHGDEVTGASTFLIGPGLDDGPVFGTFTERVLPNDTSGSLLDRLAHHGSALLVATLDGIEAGELSPVAQPDAGVSLAPKLSNDDARVRWTDPWVGVDRRIRATTPDPGAWTTLAGERVKLSPLQLREPEDGPVLAPGQIHVSKAAVWVGTASRPACLDQVQAAGRKLMSARDWARGIELQDQSFA